jgi:Arc/MetJ family transcription regulator
MAPMGSALFVGEIIGILMHGIQSCPYTHIIIDIYMVLKYNISMKTTIELSDSLLEETKKIARNQGKTIREIMENALRSYLKQSRNSSRRFTLRTHTFKGNGTQGGIQEGNWETIRALIYDEKDS